jgi:hypothetical protein
MNETSTYSYDSFEDQTGVIDPLGHSGAKTYDGVLGLSR